MAARRAGHPARPHQGQPRQGRLRHLPQGGGVRPRYRQVGAGQLAGALDAVHAHRQHNHRVGQLGSAATVGNLGRDNQVAGDGAEQPLVRDSRHTHHAGQVDHGTGRARPQERHALLGGRGPAVVGGKPGRLRRGSQLGRRDADLRRGQRYPRQHLVSLGRLLHGEHAAPLSRRVLQPAAQHRLLLRDVQQQAQLLAHKQHRRAGCRGNRQEPVPAHHRRVRRGQLPGQRGSVRSVPVRRRRPVHSGQSGGRRHEAAQAQGRDGAHHHRRRSGTVRQRRHRHRGAAGT